LLEDSVVDMVNVFHNEGKKGVHNPFHLNEILQGDCLFSKV
jgi:hypothetical protein